MNGCTEILEARPHDAHAIAGLYLSARPDGTADLSQALTDAEIIDWFLSAVGRTPGVWWIARNGGRIVGYMVLRDEDVGHLYVLPGWQGRGIGSALLEKAKALSPRRLTLFAVWRNAQLRRFYEARQFRRSVLADGDRQEGVPGVQYVWGAAA